MPTDYSFVKAYFHNSPVQSSLLVTLSLEGFLSPEHLIHKLCIMGELSLLGLTDSAIEMKHCTVDGYCQGQTLCREIRLGAATPSVWATHT